jgi:putative oxidoreductase
MIADWYRTASDLKHSEEARDAALLVARLGLAWVFIYHGAGTLFGAFHGAGLHESTVFYATVAHLRPGGLFAVLGGSIELFGAIAIALGIFGRLAGAAIAGDMSMAMITVTFANGISSTRTGGGYELNLALAALAFVVAMLGTGRFSLDRLLLAAWERRRPAGQPVGQPI